MHSEQIRLETGSREQVYDLTEDCRSFLHRVAAGDGLLHVWVPHATAGLAVIETGSGSDTDLLATLRHRSDLPAASVAMLVAIAGGAAAAGAWLSAQDAW